MTKIYKLLLDEEWNAALSAGIYRGSAVDLLDGFIHFSTRDQLAETARRHFRGQENLVCLTVEADELPDLRWEPSRGGALFPHLYGPLHTQRVTTVSAAPLDDDGVPSIDLERP